MFNHNRWIGIGFLAVVASCWLLGIGGEADGVMRCDPLTIAIITAAAAAASTTGSLVAAGEAKKARKGFGGFQGGTLPQSVQDSINLLNSEARRRLGPGFQSISPSTQATMRQQGRFDLQRGVREQEIGLKQNFAQTFGGGGGSGQAFGSLAGLRRQAVRSSGDISRAVAIKSAELTRDERLAGLRALGQAASLGIQGAQFEQGGRFAAQQGNLDFRLGAAGERGAAAQGVAGSLSNAAQFAMIASMFGGGGQNPGSPVLNDADMGGLRDLVAGIDFTSKRPR